MVLLKIKKIDTKKCKLAISQHPIRRKEITRNHPVQSSHFGGFWFLKLQVFSLPAASRATQSQVFHHGSELEVSGKERVGPQVFVDIPQLLYREAFETCTLFKDADLRLSKSFSGLRIERFTKKHQQRDTKSVVAIVYCSWVFHQSSGHSEWVHDG